LQRSFAETSARAVERFRSGSLIWASIETAMSKIEIESSGNGGPDIGFGRHGER
jgi:hypothetical protein